LLHHIRESAVGIGVEVGVGSSFGVLVAGGANVSLDVWLAVETEMTVIVAGGVGVGVGTVPLLLAPIIAETMVAAATIIAGMIAYMREFDNGWPLGTWVLDCLGDADCWVSIGGC
jgi:hypothetical protein